MGESTGQSISINYRKAYFSGTEFVFKPPLNVPYDTLYGLDTNRVTLSPDLVIESQTIGVASTSQGVSLADGILGFVPVTVTSTAVP